MNQANTQAKSKSLNLRVLEDPRNPNAESLCQAFLHAYDKDPVTVNFYVKNAECEFLSNALTMQVSGLSYEAGEPGMYIVEGYAKFPDGGWNKYKGFYNANKRSGFLDASP